MIKFSLIKPGKSPQRGTDHSAGIDFFVPDTADLIELEPGQSANIESGVKCRIPNGYALIAMNKSGVAMRGLQVGACVVDADYQGEIHIHVWNIGSKRVPINPGDKLVQFLLIPVSYSMDIEIVAESELWKHRTARGTGMAGSTGT